MNNPLLVEYARVPWLMEPQRLEQFVGWMAEQRVGENLAALQVEYTLPYRVRGDTGVIPISGVLLKSVPGWVRFFGYAATGYDEIEEMAQMALADPRVQQIELRITSPGGMVAGGMEAAAALRAADGAKPVTAVIEDLGASGAYWLAASARRIEANANAEVGSIGVYTYAVDTTKLYEDWGLKIIVIRSGEHKGMGLDRITEAQIAAVQEVIDGIAGHFIDQVAAGRRVPRERAAGWATGRVWLAPAALALGLIDAITSAATAVAATNYRNETAQAAATTEGDPKMGQEEQNTQAAATLALAEERKRVTDLKAAFPTDAGFALEAIEAGWDVTQAKAQRHDRLEKERAATPRGEKPLAYHDSDEGAGVDFMAQARARSREQKISMTEAMRQVQAEDPAAYEKFRAAERARPVRVRSGKAAGGRVSLGAA
jgi:signal peptide peptidase SppA